MIEYAVICAVLAVCLFAASPVGALLASAIRAFYKDLTFFLSLP
jgi:Flp pilus assembly pilin Flp